MRSGQSSTARRSHQHSRQCSTRSYPTRKRRNCSWVPQWLAVPTGPVLADQWHRCVRPWWWTGSGRWTGTSSCSGCTHRVATQPQRRASSSAAARSHCQPQCWRHRCTSGCREWLTRPRRSQRRTSRPGQGRWPSTSNRPQGGCRAADPLRPHSQQATPCPWARRSGQSTRTGGC